jgi:soluble lytic murein transglycosylase-like protein
VSGGTFLALVLITQAIAYLFEPLHQWTASQNKYRVLISVLRVPMLQKRTSITDAMRNHMLKHASSEVVMTAIAKYIRKLNNKIDDAKASKIAKSLVDSASRNNIDACLLTALVARESSFCHETRSPSGAIGLAQLMPETATALGITDPTDIAQNLEGAARYLKMLIELWHAREDAFEMALASYRLGPTLIKACDGIPNISNIAVYLDDVLAHFIKLQGLISEIDNDAKTATAKNGKGVASK